ncbi:hypothetical protein WDW37_14310 [Bdellovibrionota bacterium FG-1]
MTSRLADVDLQPLVRIVNRYLLNDRKLLFQLERTFETLSEKKILDNSLVEFGRLLENEEFVSSSIALLKEGFNEEGGTSNFSADRTLLLAIERLSTRLSLDHISDFTDAALTIAQARSFGALQERFHGDSLSGRKLRDLTDGVLGYLQDIGDPRHVDAGNKLIGEVISGNFFSVLDNPAVLGSDVARLGLTVPRLASILDVTLSHNAQLLDGLSSLLHYSHRPISCLKGGVSVSDGAMFMVDELVRLETPSASSFLKRSNPLTLMALNPICELPRQLGDFYPAIVSLADTAAIEPVVDIIKATQGVSPKMTKMVVDLLSDTGSAEYAAVGGPSENTAGLKRLLPVLAELTDRHAWEDLVLLLSVPREADRAGIRSELGFLVEKTLGSQGDKESVYDVLSRAVSRNSRQSFYNFIFSMRHFLATDRKMLEPALIALRQAYYVNDVHPVVDLVREILSEANSNQELFNTLFLMSDLQEFQASIRLFSNMAKDGRLKELMGAMLSVFHKFSSQGKMEIHLTSEPVFIPRARHNLISADLNHFGKREEFSLANSDCRQLDLRVSLVNTRDRDFEKELDHFAHCINSDSRHDDLEDALKLLRSEKTEDGRDFFSFGMDFVGQIGAGAHALGAQEFGFLVNRFSQLVDDQRIFKGLDAIPLFVKGIPGRVESVVAPVVELLRPVMDERIRPSIRRLEGFVARVFRRDDFVRILRYMDGLLDSKPEVELVGPLSEYDRERIKRRVWNKECDGLPSHSTMGDIERFKQQRTHQIIDDWEQAITTWDLVGGSQRRDWTLEEFKGQLDDVLTKVGEGGVLDSMLNVLRYFTLPDGQTVPNEFQHYHRDELRKFLMDRSDDHRLISYFFPGEARPRVRLVSTMDRFELVLMNADFWSIWPFVPGRFLPDFGNHRNFSLLFLSKVADAWGDEPRESWPQNIREKYRGSRPPTLAEAVHDIIGTKNMFLHVVGLPNLPSCQQEGDPEEVWDPTPHTVGVPRWMPGFDIPQMRRYLFNLEQVLSVLEENLPRRGYPLGQGGKFVNGMRIMRDLFYQLYYSTPDEYQKADFHRVADGFKNNLSVINRLVRLGLTREATRHLKGWSVDDSRVVDFFDSLMEGATTVDNPQDPVHPHYTAHSLVDPLLDSKHELIWGVLKNIFGVIDAAEGRSLDDAHSKEIQGKSVDEVNRIRSEWGRENTRMRQMAFFALAQAGPLGLIQPVVKTGGAVLHAHLSYLAQNTDKIEGLLRSKKIADLMRALYEDTDQPTKEHLGDLIREFFEESTLAVDGLNVLRAVDEDTQGAREAWQEVNARWGILTSLPEYGALGLDRLGRGALDFFEERDPDPMAKITALKIRLYLAERLEKGELDQFFLLGRRNPEGVMGIFKTLSSHIQDGELGAFFSEARRALNR